MKIENSSQRASLESCSRWRGLASLAFDLAFETDAEGRFTAFEPASALGYEASALIGMPAIALLADLGKFRDNPFRPRQAAVRREQVRVRRANGSTACLMITSMPLLDDAGRPAGACGVALDVTDQDRCESAAAATLRRGEVLDRIMQSMREEVLAPRMMQAVLLAARDALGAEGAAVLDLMQPEAATCAVLHEVGSRAAVLHDAVLRVLADGGEAPRCAVIPSGHNLLACPANTRFGDRAAVAFWHGKADQAWTEDDRLLASSVTALVRLVLEHDSIQRELVRNARADTLTGLLNRGTFLDELARRIDRLDREDLPGTLMIVDVDGLKQASERFGEDVGDEVLTGVGALLRRLVRPTDLVARLGGDEFALWLDGADQLTAAERAEALRIDADGSLARLAPDNRLITLSIGIACRRAGSGEFMDGVMRRASEALHEAQGAGRARWHVSRSEATL